MALCLAWQGLGGSCALCHRNLCAHVELILSPFFWIFLWWNVMWTWQEHHFLRWLPVVSQKYSHTFLTWTLNPWLLFSHGMKLKSWGGCVVGGCFPMYSIFLPHILKCNWVVEDESHRRWATVGIMWWLIAENTNMLQNEGHCIFDLSRKHDHHFHHITLLNHLHQWGGWMEGGNSVAIRGIIGNIMQ